MKGKDSRSKVFPESDSKKVSEETQEKDEKKPQFIVEMSIRNSMAGDLLFNGMRRDDIWQPIMAQKYDDY